MDEATSPDARQRWTPMPKWIPIDLGDEVGFDGGPELPDNVLPHSVGSTPEARARIRSLCSDMLSVASRGCSPAVYDRLRTLVEDSEALWQDAIVASPPAACTPMKVDPRYGPWL